MNRHDGAVRLTSEQKKEFIRKIKEFFLEERDEEIGELAANIYLDFILEHIAPIIYNAALDDAEQFMRLKLDDICLLRADEKR